MVEVVNMRTCNPPWGQPGDVRIDRGSVWGNPFKFTDPRAREESIVTYEDYLKNRLDEGTLDITTLLKAKRLGCHCKPLQCHGDIIKKCIEEQHRKCQTKILEE